MIHTFSVFSLQLLNKETINTMTQQVSYRPNIKCQSRSWSQRGTKKVNGSHHGDNPLYSDQQGSKSRQKVMRLYKQWHRPISKRFIKPPYSISRATLIDSNVVAYPRPALKITLQPVLISMSKFLKATHCTEIRKNEIPRSMVVEALSW